VDFCTYSICIIHEHDDDDIDVLDGSLSIGRSSLSLSLGNTFIEIIVVENRKVAVGISTLSLVVPEI